MAKQNQQEQRLLELLNSPVNRNKCGECKAHNPTWASWNLGVFLCGNCASAHRSLGSDISRVKSLSMEEWSHHELSILGKIGNKRNNQFWNEKQIPFPFDADDKDSLTMWLRNKYTGKYKYGAVLDKDYNLDDDWGDRTDDWGYDKSSTNSRPSSGRRLSNALGFGSSSNNISKNKSYVNSSSDYKDVSKMTRSMRRGLERTGTARSYYDNNYDDDNDDYEYSSSRRGNSREFEYNSRPYLSRGSSSNGRYSSSNLSTSSNSSRPNKIVFRKPIDAEYRRYGDQSRKMKFDMGYEDEDLNVEALVITRGNINEAVALIEKAGKKPSPFNNNNNNGTSNTSNPSLPQRKQSTGAIFDSTKAGEFNWLDDDIRNSTKENSNINKSEQIYQYVDPTTGNIYYVDGNGQQYIDPNQQQQVTMNPFQTGVSYQQQLPNMNTGYQQPINGFPQQQMSNGYQQQQMATGYQQQVQQPPLQQQTGFTTQPSTSSSSQLTLNQLALQQQQQQQQQQMMLQQQQMAQQQQFGQQSGYFTGF